jgi:hypothetical protein
MHLVIDHPWQKVFACSVDDGCTGRGTDAGGNLSYPIACDENIHFTYFAFIDKPRIADQKFIQW